MSRVYFTSDLHFGHTNIMKWQQDSSLRGNAANSEEHDEWLIEEWNKVVKKHDLVWVLGDIAMGKGHNGLEHLSKVGRLNGTKHCILGNHDDTLHEYYPHYFARIRGMFRYKNHWLTHAPIHPNELRGRPNIHGHVHTQSIPDEENYINVCVEANMERNGTPLVAFGEW